MMSRTKTASVASQSLIRTSLLLVLALAVPGNAWFGSAGELVGAAYLRQNRADLAGPLFAAIAKDKDVPESIRSRTQQLAGLLGVDAVTDPEVAAGIAPGAKAAAQ